jgi:hypothetical protein
MFSVDACDPETYQRQRVGGSWEVLLNSVRGAVRARAEGKGTADCRIRASVVRTHLNAEAVDSGRMEEFWKGKMGVDWISISECYFPAGTQHHWKAAHWRQMNAQEFQCADPFRRMVVTWDGRHTMPCCQGFTLEIDGGPVVVGAGAPLAQLETGLGVRQLRAPARRAPQPHLGSRRPVRRADLPLVRGDQDAHPALGVARRDGGRASLRRLACPA